MTNQYSQGRKDGVKLTVKILHGKLEELRSRFGESSNQKEDLNEQVEMMKILENAVKTKEALMQAAEEVEEARLQEAKKKQQEEQKEEAFEVLLTKEKEQKFKDFCRGHGVEILHKDFAHQKLEEILKEGCGGNHCHLGGLDHPH